VNLPRPLRLSRDEVNFPHPLRLSREEWTLFSNLASLEDSARPELEVILGMGRFMAGGDKSERPSKTPGKTPSKKRDFVTKMKRNAEKLRDDLLSELDIPSVREARTRLSNIDFLEDIPIDESASDLPNDTDKTGQPNDAIKSTVALVLNMWRTQEMLERHVKNLDSLIAWLDVVEGKIPRGKPGIKKEAPHMLARGIDRLLQRHTGARLTPSEKQSDPGRALLAACLKFLGMKIKPQTVIRRLAAERRGKVTSENS
jgi:hypothetical protein